MFTTGVKKTLNRQKAGEPAKKFIVGSRIAAKILQGLGRDGGVERYYKNKTPVEDPMGGKKKYGWTLENPGTRPKGGAAGQTGKMKRLGDGRGQKKGRGGNNT